MRILNLILKYIVYLGPVNFTDYLVQRFIRKRPILSIRVPKLKHRVAIRNNSSDIPLFAHMFILQEYDLKTNYEVKTIIDCGANVGLASLFFLTKYPTAKIIAVEPELNNFKIVVQNLKNYPNVTCVNKGVWNKKTYLKIIDGGKGNHAFTVIECNPASELCIEAISVDEIMNEFQLKNIDILKIDIEGSEEQVFLNEPSWIKDVRMIFCEIHENMKPGLTKKITKQLGHSFNISRNAEYHVFSRKGNQAL